MYDGKSMARKPKGIKDDIWGVVRGVSDFVTGTQRNPMEMPQVTQFRNTARTVVGTGAKAADLYVSGGLAGSFVRNVAIPASMVASPATKSRAEREGLKSFAVDAAAAGVGFGAAAGVTKGAKIYASAVKSGSVVNPVAATMNVLSGQKVIVHGSRTQGIQQLLPNAGSRALPNEKVLFGFDPRKNQAWHLIRQANSYATQQASSKGSIYVAKVPKKGTKVLKNTDHKLAKNTKFESVVDVSKKPGKVIKEIPSYDINANTVEGYLETYKALQKALNRAGVAPRKNANADKLIPTIKRLVKPKRPRKFYPAP